MENLLIKNDQICDIINAMTIFAIKTKLRRFFVRSLKLNRPTSYPFITGDGFRALAQHILDEISDFDPINVEKNDIIFVRNDFLIDFFTQKHPLIKNEYVLISNNDDIGITEEYKKYIDEKIIHWFVKNLLFKHEKITPIPIGVTNYYQNFVGRGNISYLYEGIDRAKNVTKKDKMSFGFSTLSNSIERTKLKKDLETNAIAVSIEEKKQSDYLKKMPEYKFTVSPDGNGIDCHRTWEALYLNVIPIVKKGLSTEYFKSIGVPLLIIEDWDELIDFDEDLLAKKYEELKAGLSNPAIYMNYWMNYIVSKRVQ